MHAQNIRQLSLEMRHEVVEGKNPRFPSARTANGDDRKDEMGRLVKICIANRQPRWCLWQLLSSAARKAVI